MSIEKDPILLPLWLCGNVQCLVNSSYFKDKFNNIYNKNENKHSLIDMDIKLRWKR